MSAASATPATATTTSLSSLMSELTSAEQKAVALRDAVNAERTKRLVGLHAELGYQNSDELIAAIRGANGKPARRARKSASGRKERTVVTPELKAKIVAAAKEGKLTGLEMAEKFGVSIGTIQNIKSDAGLVNK